MRITQESLGVKPSINSHQRRCSPSPKDKSAPEQRLATLLAPPSQADGFLQTSAPVHLHATPTLTVVFGAAEATSGPDVLKVMRNLATDFSLQQL